MDTTLLWVGEGQYQMVKQAGWPPIRIREVVNYPRIIIIPKQQKASS